jgi:uncharacterized damage-inducible protein DinB
MHAHHHSPALIGSLALAAGLVIAAPAAAQDADRHAGHHETAMPTSGVRADLLGDLDILEEKYTGLAEAMTAHYGWRPGEGVRSVSEVFVHIGAANAFIPIAANVAPPQGMEVASFEEAFARMQEMEKRVTDPTEVMKELRAGFAHARHAIATVSDEQLDDRVMFMGQEVPKRAILILLVTHMHEHLGQAVAYARMNAVVPPWSEGG